MESPIKQIAAQASQSVECRETQKKWAVHHFLDRMPGMRRSTNYHPSDMTSYFCVAVLDSYDCRMIWTSAVRDMPIERAVIREKEKMAAKKSDGTGTDALNDLDYILLNVSRNLWVAPDGEYTKAPSEAMVLKRIPALDQFINDCKNNAGDYNVPVRLQDLVACMMGLDE